MAGRRRWTEAADEKTREATDVLLAAADLRPGLRVLDLASGAGNPALFLASRVAPGGAVVATDLVADALAFAAERARARGLSNVCFGAASADALPFPDASFDRVTCRFGVMFFPDVDAALREARRVLRPGGRAVFVAWGPAQQPFFRSTFEVLLRHLDTSFAAEAEMPFRFGAGGILAQALGGAGFAGAREEFREIVLRWPGTPEEMWQYLHESGAVLRRLFEAIPPERRAAAGEEVVGALRAYAVPPGVHVPATVLVATGG
jgi:SAM-dependent methyltransferase